jgi:hypothetical protein
MTHFMILQMLIQIGHRLGEQLSKQGLEESQQGREPQKKASGTHVVHQPHKDPE